MGIAAPDAEVGAAVGARFYEWEYFEPIILNCLTAPVFICVIYCGSLYISTQQTENDLLFLTYVF